MTFAEVETIQQRAMDVWQNVLMYASIVSAGGVLSAQASIDMRTYEIRHSEIGLILEMLLGMYVESDPLTGRFHCVSPMSYVVGEA